MARAARWKATKRSNGRAAAKAFSPDKRVLLPTIDGPKIGPFEMPGFRSLFDFDFEELLSVITDSGWGGEGFVFRASFGGKTYVVKIFKFYHRDNLWVFEGLNRGRIPSEKILLENFDHFYAECRAYGRLDEIYAKLYPGKRVQDLRSEDLLAARCYGYVLMPQNNEPKLFRKCGFDMDLKRFTDQHGNLSVRALVKEYIPPPEIDPKKRSIKRMLRDLKTLHDYGLYPRDIALRNYRSGLLIEFGIAVTTPSLFLDLENDTAEERDHWHRTSGRYSFDEMVREAGIKTQVQASEGFDWRPRTRAEKKTHRSTELVMLDPRRGKRHGIIVVRK